MWKTLATIASLLVLGALPAAAAPGPHGRHGERGELRLARLAGELAHATTALEYSGRHLAHHDRHAVPAYRALRQLDRDARHFGALLGRHRHVRGRHLVRDFAELERAHRVAQRRLYRQPLPRHVHAQLHRVSRLVGAIEGELAVAHHPRRNRDRHGAHVRGPRGLFARY